MRAICAIGAHLDDAALSCGQLLAGRPDTVVVTALAAFPPDELKLTAYDAATGFSTSKDAVAVRRAEDVEALSVLQARPIHLNFLDSQYGLLTEPGDIAVALGELIDELEPEFVCTNLGLKHPDHVLVREAVLQAMRGRETPLYVWEDLPTRVQAPETVTEALSELRGRGYKLEQAFIGTGPLAMKMDALWSYRSQMQLPEFANRHELLVGERFWKVTQ